VNGVPDDDSPLDGGKVDGLVDFYENLGALRIALDCTEEAGLTVFFPPGICHLAESLEVLYRPLDLQAASENCFEDGS
jgi:hypothetical protein